ncbi:MAG: hypothetical protein N2C12_04160, partial [Planctomycetales bacterium]
MKAPDELAGKKGLCPECQGVVLLIVDPQSGSLPQIKKELPAIKFSEESDEPTGTVTHDQRGEGGLDFN